MRSSRSGSPRGPSSRAVRSSRQRVEPGVAETLRISRPPLTGLQAASASGFSQLSPTRFSEASFFSCPDELEVYGSRNEENGFLFGELGRLGSNLLIKVSERLILRVSENPCD